MQKQGTKLAFLGLGVMGAQWRATCKRQGMM